MTAPDQRSGLTDSTVSSGVLSDGAALVTAINNGSWVDGGLASFAFDPGTVDDDPFAVLDAAGLGWVREHLAPLPGWLDDLTGNAEQVRAFSQTWAEASRQLSAAATEMGRVVTSDLVDTAGDAADAYRGLAGDVAAHVEGTAAWAEGVSTGLQMASTLQDAVAGHVRGTVARLVGSALTVAAAGPPGSLAAPALADSTAAQVAQASAEVGPSVAGLVGSLRTLGGLLEDLGGVMGRARRLFADVPGRGRGALRQGRPRASAPLPDVSDLSHPREGGDLTAWASGVASRHGTLTAGEVAAVYRSTDGDLPAVGALPAARARVAESMSGLGNLPAAPLRTEHLSTLPPAATDSVRLGQQLPADLLVSADDGNAQVHIDWAPRPDDSALSHYGDQARFCPAYLEVTGRQWNRPEGRWEIFVRQR